ncbi:unnamed protein product [Urochloa humidicola]
MARRPGGDGYSPTRFGREGDCTPTEMAPLFPGGEGKMASTKQTMAPASTAISTVSFFHSICFYTCTAGEAVAEQGAAATGLVRAAAGARAGTGQAPGSERGGTGSSRCEGDWMQRRTNGVGEAHTAPAVAIYTHVADLLPDGQPFVWRLPLLSRRWVAEERRATSRYDGC